MTRKVRSTFSTEFKREAVRLLEQSDKDTSQLARELGVRRNQLYKWKAEMDNHGAKAFPGSGRRQKPQDETARLKKEIADLKEENEILKKAARYFARELG